MSDGLLAFRLRRFLALAPSVFCRDAVFRYAVIGAALALLALLSRLWDVPGPVVPAPIAALAPSPISSPPPPLAAPLPVENLSAPVPPPASLGADYGAPQQPFEAKRAPAPVSNDPPRIAPSRRLDELRAAPSHPSTPERFGVIPRASPEKQ
jgi:hypothetical protein